MKDKRWSWGHKACLSGDGQRYSVLSTCGLNSRKLRLHHCQARATTSESAGEKDKKNSVRKRGWRVAENLRERRKGRGGAVFKPFPFIKQQVGALQPLMHSPQ